MPPPALEIYALVIIVDCLYPNEFLIVLLLDSVIALDAVGRAYRLELMLLHGGLWEKCNAGPKQILGAEDRFRREAGGTYLDHKASSPNAAAKWVQIHNSARY